MDLSDHDPHLVLKEKVSNADGSCSSYLLLEFPMECCRQCRRRRHQNFVSNGRWPREKNVDDLQSNRSTADLGSTSGWNEGRISSFQMCQVHSHRANNSPHSKQSSIMAIIVRIQITGHNHRSRHENKSKYV